MARNWRTLSAIFGTAVLLVGLLGCASTSTSTPTWSPGSPDALTHEHYLHAAAAIQAKSKHDAQAALFLLQTDVTRMRTNSVDMEIILAALYAVIDAVNKEDWDTARKVIQQVHTSYGGS